MTTNIQFPDRSRSTASIGGYQRTGVVAYLWLLRLDNRDPQIQRDYEAQTNETCFTIQGLPEGSRLHKISDEQGFTIQIYKDRFLTNGKVIQFFLKGEIPYNPRWEIGILSPS